MHTPEYANLSISIWLSSWRVVSSATLTAISSEEAPKAIEHPRSGQQRRYHCQHRKEQRAKQRYAARYARQVIAGRPALAYAGDHAAVLLQVLGHLYRVKRYRIIEERKPDYQQREYQLITPRRVVEVSVPPYARIREYRYYRKYRAGELHYRRGEYQRQHAGH